MSNTPDGIVNQILGKGKNTDNVTHKIIHRHETGVGPGIHEASETSMEEKLEHVLGIEKMEAYHKKRRGIR